MQKKRPIGITIVGVIQILICLCLGTSCLVLGLSWVLLDVLCIVTLSIANLTGLGLIIGSMILGIGFFFLLGIKQALLLLKLDPKGRKYSFAFMILATALSLLFPKWIPLFMVPIYIALAVFLTIPRVREQFTGTEAFVLAPKLKKVFVAYIIIVIGISAFFAIRGLIDWRKPHSQPYCKFPAKTYQERDDEILEEIRSKGIATVRVIYRRKSLVGNPEYINGGSEEREEIIRKYIINTFVKPAGAGDMPFFRIPEDANHFFAQVTKPGFCGMRNGGLTTFIELKDDDHKDDQQANPF